MMMLESKVGSHWGQTALWTPAGQDSPHAQCTGADVEAFKGGYCPG